MHELKAGLNAKKFATFWMLPKSFYHSFVSQMTFMHSTTTLRAESPSIFLAGYSTTGWRQIHLRDFEKPWKHMESVERNVELFL